MERPGNWYELDAEKRIESPLQNGISHRVVIWELNHYCWAIMKYSQFEPPDKRNNSTFL
jgi:hypothetical protein